LAFSALIDSTADLRRDSTLFDGFIAKPVSPAELVRKVAAYVDLLTPVRKRSESPRQNRARREPSETAARAETVWQ
jgi:response regulator RpfG family c-di-GMP phosphodiesterase